MNIRCYLTNVPLRKRRKDVLPTPEQISPKLATDSL